MAGAFKVPGVYVVEKNAFPNSAVEVATAVPAFIGYTERAENKGASLLNHPWRILSLSEFHAHFGHAAVPSFTLDKAVADGNSLDWRYINVRRTMIMLEESIKLACKAYVFEPNVANTWITIKSMIQNFLNGIWKRGGLAGSSPDEAFGVFVGLGETMTAEDILEGILRVTVQVALSRPAQFIEITFQQQLQKS